MPIPSKTKGSPYMSGGSCYLSDDDKTELIDVLGIEDEDEKHINEIISKIRIFIGIYEEAKKTMDNAPRPANYLAELQGTGLDKQGRLKNGLRRQSYDLAEALSSLSYWMTDEFREQKYELSEFIGEIYDFIAVCRKIELKYEGQESRKRPQMKARRMIVNHLKIIYDEFNGWKELESDNGEYWDSEERFDERQRPLSEKKLLEYIRLCLKIGNIPCPEKDDSIISIFYTDETPSDERLYLRSF